MKDFKELIPTESIQKVINICHFLEILLAKALGGNIETERKGKLIV